MKVGFIGYGRMGGALAKGSVASGVLKKNQVVAFDHTAGSLQQAKRDGLRAAKNLADLLRSSSFVFICVKPQGMAALLAELNELSTKISFRLRCFVSIAAGVRLKDLEKGLGPQVAVFRAMPNTPALLNAGVTGLCRGRFANATQAKTVEKILRGIGDVVWTTDEKMDAVTAVSGSGPAYIFYAAEAMMEAARRFGFSKHEARRLVHRTVHGAGLMLEQRTEPAEELRRQVTSPGGTTEAAIREMDRSGLKKIFGRALGQAVQRSRYLSRQITLRKK